MKKPTAIMVGADKGGVGKTMMTRIILDYIKQKSVTGTIKVFDTEYPKGILNRFYPESTIVDLNNIKDQMRVLDNLNDAVSIIDIRAGLLSPALKNFSEIGLLDAVKKEEIGLVIFHVLGSNIASLNEVIETMRTVQGAKYFLVKNHMNDAEFFEWDVAISNALSLAPSINIPQLNGMAAEHIDQAAVPFSTFIDGSGNSFVLRGKARHWREQVFAELDRIGFKEMV
jgi:dethiobiotin synthetase